MLRNKDWFKLEELQRIVVKDQGYESPLWHYVGYLKSFTPMEIKLKAKIKKEQELRCKSNGE